MSRLFAGSSAWASVCACVLWRRMDFRAVDACAHGCPWTLVWLRGACVVRAWLSCARSCCVCACGLMCVPGGPFLWLKPPGRSAPGGCFPSPRPRQLPPPTVGEKPEFVRLVEEKRAPQGGGSDLVGKARCAFPLLFFGSSSDVGGFVFSVVRRLPLLARLIRLSLIVC